MKVFDYPLPGLYTYTIKDFYNDVLKQGKARCEVIGETDRSYQIKLLDCTNVHFAQDILIVRKKSVFISYRRKDGYCEKYQLSVLNQSCLACLQKCYQKQILNKDGK
jgi:hypothetical protein